MLHASTFVSHEIYGFVSIQPQWPLPGALQLFTGVLVLQLAFALQLHVHVPYKVDDGPSTTFPVAQNPLVFDGHTPLQIPLTFPHWHEVPTGGGLSMMVRGKTASALPTTLEWAIILIVGFGEETSFVVRVMRAEVPFNGSDGGVTVAFVESWGLRLTVWQLPVATMLTEVLSVLFSFIVFEGGLNARMQLGGVGHAPTFAQVVCPHPSV